MVLKALPRSQHRPIGITVTLAVSTTSIPNRRLFNLKKANWEGFSDELEHLLQELEPIPDNYDQFSKMVRRTAQQNIPRVCYTNYISGLTPTAPRMYFTYKYLSEIDPFSPKTFAAGEEVINAISQQRQSIWQTTVKGMNMARNSPRAWNLIGKLNNDNTKSTQQHCNITASKIAHQLLLNGKTPHSVKQLKPNLKTNDFNPHFTKPFSLQELKCCISTLKNGKATELDNILTEELKHLGPTALKWLLQLYDNCIATMNIPKICLKSRVIALLKPDKDPALATSYRPISCLSHSFKLMERLLLNCFSPFVKEHLSSWQINNRSAFKSNSIYRGWIPGKKDHQSSLCRINSSL